MDACILFTCPVLFKSIHSNIIVFAELQVNILECFSLVRTSQLCSHWSQVETLCPELFLQWNWTSMYVGLFVQKVHNSMIKNWQHYLWLDFGKSVLMSHFTTQIFITKMRNGNFQSTWKWLQCVVPTLNYQKIIGNTWKSSVTPLLWSQ